MEQEIGLKLLDDALSFIGGLPLQARKKIYYNIDRVLFGERSAEIFKKLGNTEIREFRTLCDKTTYRLFAFWDKREKAFVVATHGIVKKTRKTPAKEIAKAERIRKEYFNEL
ncbi:MAG: type II toxin-antitoxin system RelE/ParE family toxin [Prevotella sp.]|nr:type II toxin-antitoxin system RelE/ParE family toxin [Prevotella sp.]